MDTPVILGPDQHDLKREMISPEALRVLLFATLALAAMRWFNADALQGVRLHFVGATIATLMGRPEQGAVLWARIDQQVQRAAARVPAALRGQKVYFEVDSAPYAAGSTSFLGELLTQLGLGNIVPPALGPFPKLNPEFIVKAQPDLVMAVERNLRDMPRRPGWSTLKALQTGRTCAFDATRYEMLVRPGPRLGEAAELVADCLQALP